MSLNLLILILFVIIFWLVMRLYINKKSNNQSNDIFDIIDTLIIIFTYILLILWLTSPIFNLEIKLNGLIKYSTQYFDLSGII